MRRSILDSFLRKERRVNAPEYDPGAPPAHLASDLVAAPRIPRVNADPDDIAGSNGAAVQRFERLVDNPRIAPARTGGRRQHVEPARRNHGDAE